MRILSLLLTLTALLAAVPAAAAQPGQRCFPETGFCIAGPIRDYWERNGGLPVFGYPIAPQQTETVEGSWTGPVQWFERDRLEDHSGEGLGVLAGRLGARYLELQGRPWAPGADVPPARPGDPCRHFPVTGYNVCTPAFRATWEQQGGLERFGYPITPAFEEVIEGRSYTVQYFERRRMELHPENAGTPYEVLLGLLGREIFAGAQRPPSNQVRPDPRLTRLLVLSRDDAAGLSLVRVARDGSGAAPVDAEPRRGIYPYEPLAWAPDGRAVAFTDRSPPAGVFVLSADGRSLERVAVPAAPGTIVEWLDWSPDGAALLLGLRPTRDGIVSDPSGTIAVLPFGGDLRLIGEGLRPRWSPDGGRVLFERPSGQPESARILVMGADGSQAREVALGRWASWSPDGGRIVFTGTDGFVTIVGSDGGGARRVAGGRLAAWSPDGSRIAYARGDGDLIVAYADGSDPREVLDFPGAPTANTGPAEIFWSPDGAQLAYRFNEPFGSQAGVVNLDGSGLLRLSGGLLPPRWQSE